MKTILLSTAALALSAPAFAQDASAPAAPPAAEAQAPVAQPAPADPVAILKAEFPNYDKDASGELSKPEFSSWLTALRNLDPNKTALTAAQETQWLTKAFADADADKTKSVNLAELTAYLTKKS